MPLASTAPTTASRRPPSWRYGKLSGKIAADGTFAISGKTGPNNDALTMTGTIQGERLTARWSVIRKKVDCAGEISARR